MVKSASKPTHGITATVAGFIILMVGASAVLGQLKDALNTVWAVKPKPGLGASGFIRDKFSNFEMVLTIGFSLGLTTNDPTGINRSALIGKSHMRLTGETKSTNGQIRGLLPLSSQA